MGSKNLNKKSEQNTTQTRITKYPVNMKMYSLLSAMREM